ncbi:hypothetical protein RB623_20140 [Mesorhizobium sp. LHD-90]|uniref:glutamate racemase n=1 Tax=Mesorhizobium sp. LHD-90 TaxID=3071414 RepID=UPI0027DFF1CC|nr:hypothetical protein [Mesorhizobium sp. LHD-90]MDQ6436370.1 hypothetical protein [Mesorhizobium sp. LHD-90]
MADDIEPVTRREPPTIVAKRAIGVFDSGSGGMVTAAWLLKMLADADLSDISVVFFGDTANLPYGTKTQEHVAKLSDAIIERLSSHCPVIGIACNTASASWAHFGSAGKSDGLRQPKVFSVVEVAAQQAYDRARVLPDPKMKRGRKTIGVLGTELTAEIQSHAERIVERHRRILSDAIGHQLPLIHYTFGRDDIEPTLPADLIDYKHTPHIAVFREDEPGPGGTTRAGIRHWTPPEHLPHDVEIIARAAQKLVAAVDVAHILDAEGLVKQEWREKLAEYLHEVSGDLVRRKTTALILGCTHFEFFERAFAKLLPTLAARNSIVSPSGALAVALFDAFGEYADAHPVQPVAQQGHAYFAFSGDRPPTETFQGLGITNPVDAELT